ncbi:hypothetical protein ACNRWW_11560 [Metabacillus sp. HB246100]
MKRLIAFFACLSISLYGFVLMGMYLPITNPTILGFSLGFSFSAIGYISIIELLFPSLKKEIELFIMFPY